MNREQFLTDRKLGIGGSDVGAIIGVSPFKTALDVYNDKISEVVVEEYSEDMARGNRAEKYVLEEYAEREGVELVTELETVLHPDYPFMRGNLDAKIKDQNVVVEAKSTKAPMSMWDAGIPEYYKAQVAYYAILTNADRVDIAVLFSGWQYGCYTYWRDADYEEYILKSVIDFWKNHVEARIPPAPQSQEEIQQVYADIDEEMVIKADKHIKHVVEEYEEVADQIKVLEKEKSSLKNTIQIYMGEAGLLDADFCKVALKDRVTKRLDTTALKNAVPDIYEKYLKETHSRFLTFLRD